MLRNRLCCALLVVALLACATPVFAVDLGARAMGMGGAYVALADDASAVYWNPAGLAQVKVVSVVPSVSVYTSGLENMMDLFDAINDEQIPTATDFAVSAGGAGLAGVATKRFAISYLTTADLQATFVLDAPLEDPPEKQIQADSRLVNATVLSAAIPIAKVPFNLAELSIGANVKLLNGTGYAVSADIDEDPQWSEGATARGFGVDLGAQAKLTEWLKAGLMIRDAYNSLEWDGALAGTAAPRPSIEAGIAVKPLIPGLTVAADIERTEVDGESFTRFKAGLEQSLFGLAALRVGGYTNPGEDSTVYTAGLGVGLFKFARLEVAASSDLEDGFGFTGTIIAQF